MSDRNQPCPCGSGKKLKKCCGAAAKAAASQVAAAPAQEVGPTPETPETSETSAEGMPFFKPMGRGLESEKTDADRHKHLRRRLQDSGLRGTLVYNNGAFFRPPPRKPGP